MREFYHTIEKSKDPDKIGKIGGFLIGGRCRMNRYKVDPIKKRIREYTEKEDYEEYIGIAIDEPNRLERLREKKGKISLLEQFGYTEKMAFDKCEEYGLLSPIYKISKRGGCWFCPNQNIAAFAWLKQNHGELWGELSTLSRENNKASECFSYRLHFEDVDKKVDEYILQQKTTPIQLSIFDMLGEF